MGRREPNKYLCTVDQILTVACFYSPASPHQSKDKKIDHVPLTSQHDTVASFVLFRFTSCPSSTTLPRPSPSPPICGNIIAYLTPPPRPVSLLRSARSHAEERGGKYYRLRRSQSEIVAGIIFPTSSPPLSDANQAHAPNSKLPPAKFHQRQGPKSVGGRIRSLFGPPFFSFSLLDTSGDEILGPRKRVL